MSKKLYNFRFAPDFDKDLDFLKNKIKAKNRTDAIEKAIKKLIHG